jgi:DNA-binding transcriptional ArsR family regulator
MSEWLELSDLKTMLRALADEARLNIVHHLAGLGEVNVTEICQALDISQPLVSWHLTMLRRAGLVRRRRLGRQVYCSLDKARFQRCQEWLASLVKPTGTADIAHLELQGEPVQP